MRSPWRHLSLGDIADNIPPLLARHDIENAKYSVWITDLTFVWEEVLDRKQIIQRSFTLDTSIDPSEGPDQLLLLLESVRRALDEQPGTNIAIARNDGDQQLLLRSRTPLPGSLKPLRWEIELSLAPQSRMTSELIVPILGQQVIVNVERASLLQQMKEKDHVISKLLDKMQSDGIDLTRVFPGLGSVKPGRQSSRQAFGKSIKGLAEFDEQQWRDRLRLDAVSAHDFNRLVSDAFRNGMVNTPVDACVPDYSGWWRNLRHNSSQQRECSQKPDSVAEEEDLMQGDFQRQPTPTNLVRVSPSMNEVNFDQKLQVDESEPQREDSDSTTDESNSNSPRKHSGSKDRNKASADTTSFKSSPLVSTNSKIDVRQSMNKKHTSITAIDSDSETSTSSSDDSIKHRKKYPKRRLTPVVDKASNAQSSMPIAKRKLGKIGGALTANQRNSSPDVVDIGMPSPSRPRVDSRMDSAKNIKTSESNDQINSWVGEKAQTQPPAPEPPRESSQERANRKREQLKRELESKPQAGGKKKRKF
ncbi:hypothetical protein ACLMJK_008593 [Lecanora helva]